MGGVDWNFGAAVSARADLLAVHARGAPSQVKRRY